MKKLFLVIVAMVAFATTADAQGFLKRLKEKAINAVENSVERKVESKAERRSEEHTSEFGRA